MEANTVNVAQAISRTLDEAREGFASDLTGGLFIDPDDDGSDLRVVEVSAELETSFNFSEFQVKTSDGRTFSVRVSERFPANHA